MYQLIILYLLVCSLCMHCIVIRCDLLMTTFLDHLRITFLRMYRVCIVLKPLPGDEMNKYNHAIVDQTYHSIAWTAVIWIRVVIISITGAVIVLSRQSSNDPNGQQCDGKGCRDDAQHHKSYDLKSSIYS